MDSVRRRSGRPNASPTLSTRLTMPASTDPISASQWLDGRLETVPPELAAAVRGLVAEVSLEDGRSMADAALVGLARVVSQEEERAGALELLAADALLTYAFEAAADPRLGGSAESASQLADRVGPCGAIGAELRK